MQGGDQCQRQHRNGKVPRAGSSHQGNPVLPGQKRMREGRVIPEIERLDHQRIEFGNSRPPVYSDFVSYFGIARTPIRCCRGSDSPSRWPALLYPRRFAAPMQRAVCT